MQLNQVTLPALDITAAVGFYQTLGFELIVSSPHYARFKSTVGDSTFSVHVVETLTGLPQTIIYFECAALDEQVEELKGRGVTFLSEPEDQRWLWREARLSDPSGNVICLYHAGENRLNPPWRVRA